MGSERSRRITLILIAFAVGAAAGAASYKNIAHWIAKHHARPKPLPPYDRQRELLLDAFVDELVGGERLLDGPCATAEDVSGRLERQFRAPASAFANAYESMILQGGEAQRAPAEPDRLRVSYKLDASAARRGEQEAWAYRLEGPGGPSATAVLIIPGSGKNESSKIVRGDPKDYHGDIAALCRSCGDAYVLVKPNEDFRAIHDGRKKLSYLFVTNFLLNRGMSYSGQYLCDALAVVKHLQGRYRRVYVAGLSQGGTAALYVALQSQPSGAVVASGYSATTQTLDASGPDQILLPGISALYSPEAVRRRIGQLSTRFLFSYGKAERGAYRVEAEEGPTRKFLSGLGNVEFVVHEGGHAFPREAVRAFLSAPAAESSPAKAKAKE